MHLFDTHFHVDGKENPRQFAERAFKADVTHLLAVGSDYTESAAASNFASKIPNSWFSAGVHPHEASKFKNEISMFEEFAENPKMAAVGEIGVDYYYRNSDRNSQIKVMDKFIEFAFRKNYPVIIHCRDSDGSEKAYGDAYSLLADFAGNGGRFVIHCFTGTALWAEKFLELGNGTYIGITGIVTFPKAENVRTVLKIIPENRLLLETDSPYLAPVPHRGEKNHPEYLKTIAEYIANLKKMPVEKIAETTTSNALDFFKIIK